MCLQPKHIPNPTSHYKRGLDKVEIDVPCGDCAECRAGIRHDWYVRSYAEWQKYKTAGGRVLFCTLTYNDLNLPRFNDYGIPINHCCFDYTHTRKFINDLRTYYSRSIGNGSCEGINYIIFSEYGHYTKRSHYHALIFFPPVEKSVHISTYKDLIHKAWKYGFSYFSKEEKGGAEVLNEKSINYCSKYACKDLDFYNVDEIKQFEQDCKKKIRDKEITYNEKMLFKKFRQHCPHHRQGKGFGYDFLKKQIIQYQDDLKNPLFTKDGLDILVKGYRIPMTTQRYKIPRYVRKRLCYDNSDEGFAYLNNTGVEVEKALFDYQFKEKVTAYKRDLTRVGFETLTKNVKVDRKNYINDVLKVQGIKCIEDLRQKLLDFVKNVTFEDIVAYELVYRNRSCVDPSTGDYKLFVYDELASTFSAEKLTESAKAHKFIQMCRENDTRNFPKNQKDDNGVTIIEHSAYLNNRNKLRIEKMYLYNDLPCYAGFEAFVCLMSDIRTFSRLAAARAENRKAVRISALRDKMYNITQTLLPHNNPKYFKNVS